MTQAFLDQYRSRVSRNLVSRQFKADPYLVRRTYQMNDLAGLVSWVRAEDLDASLNDGDVVATWSDISGNANDWTESTNRPTFQTNELNGYPSVQFDGTNDRMLSSITFNSGSFSIIFVARYTGISASRRTIQGSNNWLMGPYTGSWKLFNGSAFLNSLGPPATADQGALVMACVETIGTSTTLWAAGTKASLASGSAPGTLQMGFGTPGFNEAFGGDLFELGVYNVALTEDQILGLSYGLEKKYGLR